MSSVDVIEAADCEEILVLRDRRASVVAVIAVHDTRLGPAHGGIRRWRYDGLGAAVADVVALAEAMTRKCALAEVAAGGGKAVIVDRDELDRAAAYRLVGEAVERLGGRFFTGPDVGTGADDLAIVAGATRYVATDAADGPGDLALATAAGVAAAIAAVAERLGAELSGFEVNVQGLGAVGMRLCELLAAAGAELAVTDPLSQRVEQAVKQFGARAVAPTDILARPADLFAPCALGGIVTEEVAAQLPVRGICGAANNLLASPAAAAVLHARGVLAVPDFVANAGALIAGATWHLTRERVGLERIRRIGATATELLARSAAEDLPPHAVALRIVDERLARAGATGTQDRP